MFSTEQKFNITGDNKRNLRKALECALFMSDDKIAGYTTDPRKGIVFYWSDSIIDDSRVKRFTADENGNRTNYDEFGNNMGVIFPKKKTLEDIEDLVNIITDYLDSFDVSQRYKELRQKTAKDGFFIDGSDGMIENGWEFFLPEPIDLNKKYGIKNDFYAVVGIRPALTFYGK